MTIFSSFSFLIWFCSWRLMGVSLQSGDSVRLNPWGAAALKALSVGTHLWQPRVCCFCLRLWRPWPRQGCTQSARYTPGDTCNHKKTLCSTAPPPQQAAFTGRQLLAEETVTYCIRLMLSGGKVMKTEWAYYFIFLVFLIPLFIPPFNDIKLGVTIWKEKVTYTFISSCRSQLSRCFDHILLCH